MDVINELKYFYNSQAKKFHDTRKKKWPEFDLIKEIILNYDQKELSILELGCGSGRLFKYINYEINKKISYKGVDISEKLVQIAKSENEFAQFEVDDMLSFLSLEKYEKYDLVIAVASFQHIYSKKDRMLILKNIYKVLKYNGLLVFINWSKSDWFKKKYKKPLFNAFVKHLLSLGYYDKNDLLIPWKDGDNLINRYYHIFSLQELTNLINYAGFVITNKGYVNEFGQLSNILSSSRNSIVIAEKNVIKN